MNTSLNWIKAMVPGLDDVTDQQFRDAMTLSGTKVECFTAYDKNLDKIVVGQIESVEKHPDADKLVICKVNVGDSTVQIVTGAPNIEGGPRGGGRGAGRRRRPGQKGPRHLRGAGRRAVLDAARPVLCPHRQHAVRDAACG